MAKKLKSVIALTVMFLMLCSLFTGVAASETPISNKLLVIYNMNTVVKNGVSYYPVHVYAGIDSLDYSGVGFTMRAVNATTDATQSKDTKTVYSSMNVKSASGNVTNYTAGQLGGAYMFGHEMLFNVNNWSNADATIYVTPYVVTLDGDTIEGRTLTLTDEVIKGVNPSSSLFKENEVGAPDDTPTVTPDDVIGSGSADIIVADGKLAEDVTITADGVSAVVPAGTSVTEGTTQLTLTLSTVKNSESDVVAGDSEILSAYDVHIDGIAEDNTVPAIVTIDEATENGFNSGNIKFYHVENGETTEMTEVSNADDLDAHNQFAYDETDGTITVALASFSEIAFTVDTNNYWNGKYDLELAGAGTEADPYLISNADELAGLSELVSNENAVYGSAFYKVIADITFGTREYYEDPEKFPTDDVRKPYIFYPIGYRAVGGTPEAGTANKAGEKWYTYGGAFSGTFDGDGHVISGIYQRTWDMDGDYDYGYWKKAMGLFGYVYGGTVKNLTIDNFYSVGEFTPTGCVAAYAENSTFENIALTNCNPNVYNTGNGGIVGIGGDDTDEEDFKLTFKNITIDNTNKISALWGSWDVACGGLIGMFRGPGSVYMDNCHVAAQIDVFNDVCGNYQYYWYRYAGILIGTNFNMITDDKGYTVPETDKFHATDCTVHFGDWNNYWYCELVANSLASYTHDHQFSRLDRVDSVDTVNKTYTIDGQTYNVPASGRYNYVVVTKPYSSENATCYHFVDGAVWNHEDSGKETVDVDGDGVKEEVLKEDRQHYYLPFNQLFTGYGWGVKHIPVYNGEDYAFEGVTILDRVEANSVTKFESTGVVNVITGTEISVSDLFTEKAGLEEAKTPVDKDNVLVSATALDESNQISATYVKSTTDKWEDGKVTFHGTGLARVTIQDYNFCKPTEVIINIISDDLIGCVTGDTLITVAGGATKKASELSLSDKIKVRDFYNGEAAEVNPIAVINHGDGIYKATKLTFSDDTTLEFVLAHELFDVDANSFVYISADNAEDYIGHSFRTADGVLELTGVEVGDPEKTAIYTILSEEHFNYYANGLLSLTPSPVKNCENFFRFFTLSDDELMYDEDYRLTDIENYGLYDYDDFEDEITYNTYNMFGAKYFKVLVEKGLITFDEVVEAIKSYAAYDVWIADMDKTYGPGIGDASIITYTLK